MVPLNLFTFVRRLAMKTVLRNNRYRPLAISALLLTLVYLGYVYIFKSYQTPHISLLPIEKDHISEYCNFPLDTHGHEGSAQDDKTGGNGLSLEMAQVMIRHGDRSTAKTIKGFETRDMNCLTKPKHGNDKKLFEGYHQVIKRFSQRKMTTKASSHYFTSYSDICGTGQLTQKGYLQHFELGRHLRDSYSQFHIDGIGKEHLYLRSTDYDRTVQSAASLLYGFLDLDTMEKGVVLNVSTDTWFREENSGNLPACPSVARYKQKNLNSPKYRAGLAAMEPLMNEVASKLVVTRKSLPAVSYIADYAYVFSCQGLAPPCGEDGCMTKDMAYKLMAYANWRFTNQYTGTAEILTHPLLAQIATRMVNKSQGKSPIKFALYSGHDSTITPVLVALDIFDHRWIRYASRLVFELWKDKITAVEKSTEGYKGWFMRVLFNGKVLTGKLTFCKGKIAANAEFCPLDHFISWLSGGQGFQSIHTRYTKLCQ